MLLGQADLRAAQRLVFQELVDVGLVGEVLSVLSAAPAELSSGEAEKGRLVGSWEILNERLSVLVTW
ncbi:hypothetical protein [Nesterenkonia natronophila]|uniref:hypothetical protein n=1 Tax=Nesterenkonia natronophila TaxID=2174932 RepID=UPI001CEFA23D|nr:hypothetical protein [Nesterenkonia natronophila]